jgi:hypothetical protein
VTRVDLYRGVVAALEHSGRGEPARLCDDDLVADRCMSVRGVVELRPAQDIAFGTTADIMLDSDVFELELARR